MNVPLKQVLSDVLSNDGFTGMQKVKITAAHFGGNLESDVEQLPHAAVIGGVFLIVANNGDELLGRPLGYGIR